MLALAKSTALRSIVLLGFRASTVLALELTCFACPALAESGAPETNTQGDAPPAGDKQAERARALELFEQSSALYDQGDFRAAVALLERAFETFPEPILLYNMGRAREGLGEDEAAILAYEKYLSTQIEAKDRGAILRRLETLKGRVDERRRVAESQQQRAATARKQLAATPPGCGDLRQGSSQPTLLPWVVTGVGTLGLASSGVLWLLAFNRQDQAQRDADVGSARHDQTRARELALGANIALIGGGILTAAGAAWGIVAWRSRNTNASAPIGLAFGPAAVWLSGPID